MELIPRVSLLPYVSLFPRINLLRENVLQQVGWEPAHVPPRELLSMCKKGPGDGAGASGNGNGNGNGAGAHRKA